MKRNCFFSVSRLPMLLMLLSMTLLVACGGSGKKHHANDEDGDELEEEDEEEAVVDIAEADNEGAALFDLLYDINAHADYDYTDQVLVENGFRLEKKELYDEGINEYVCTYNHPDYGEVVAGWFGAVGYGLTLTTDAQQLAEEVMEQADERGFKLEDGTDYMYSDGKCWIWKNDTGFWMYGRAETDEEI